MNERRGSKLFEVRRKEGTRIHFIHAGRHLIACTQNCTFVPCLCHLGNGDPVLWWVGGCTVVSDPVHKHRIVSDTTNEMYLYEERGFIQQTTVCTTDSHSLRYFMFLRGYESQREWA